MMDATTREDFFWLMSDAAAPLLDRAIVSFRHAENPVRLAKSLRRDVSPARSALVMEQAQLRLRATAKFSLAEQMFFTRRGLEQSTGSGIARYKASRFADLETVADVCCGIGGDLMGLADRHANNDSPNDRSKRTTIGVEADELTARFAEYNCGLLEDRSAAATTVTVHHVSFENFDLLPVQGLHCDPDRRGKKGRGERTVHGSRFEPPLESVFDRALGDKRVRIKLVGIKVAPATPAADSWPAGIEREWIGDRRECKQQVLWIGDAASRPSHITATCVDEHGVATRLSVAASKPIPQLGFATSIGTFIYEPHPTILAARLGAFLGHQYELKRIATDVAYMTGDNESEMPLVSSFRVREVMPMNLQKVADVLQTNDIGTLEVKRRGVEQVAGERFSRLKLTGSNHATVILTRIGNDRIAVIADRVTFP